MTMAARKPKAPDQPTADTLKQRRSAAMQMTGPQLLGAHMQSILLGDDVLDRSDLTLHEMTMAVTERADEVIAGNLTGLERRLAIQANSLDTIFNRLADRAAQNMGQHLDAVEKYMRLALKAQAQCRATIETIHLMHNPTQIIRQTNIAQGHQQVVNGTQGGAGKIESVQSKLLDAPQQSMTAEGLKHDLDSRKAAAAV